MAHRSWAPDLPRAERTERRDGDRYEYERDRDRYGDVRERFEEEDDHVYVRRALSHSPPRLFRSGDEDDVVFRERHRVVYDDEPPRSAQSRHSPSPGLRRRPPSSLGSEVERSRVVIEKERYRSPSPSPVRPRLLRRQSSRDTFDRSPRGYYERDEDGPPARREDCGAPPYVDMPLPPTRALPPPRVYAERDYYDELQVPDPHRYGDDDFRASPGRVCEREVVRTRRRTRSRDSRATSRPGRSRATSTSSSSSSTSGTTLTARREYPKKGKTRIPARLVSRRALTDLGYSFVEQGNTIIVQKALGQQNIDDVLKLSNDYKKDELEIVAARSSAGDMVEERVERRTEVYEGPAALVAAARLSPAGTGPVVITKEPSPVEVVKTAVIRNVSPARTYTASSYDTTSTSYDTFNSAIPVVREVSERVPVGPIALASRARRRSLGSDELRSEIRHLERQLVLRDGRRHHHHRHHHDHSSRSSRRSRRSRSRSHHRRSSSREVVVRAERLSTGKLVLYEDDEVALLEEPARGGVWIERDMRGPPKLVKAMLATLT